MLFVTAGDKKIADMLKDIHIFKNLDYKERLKIAKFFRRKRYSKDTRIVKEGEAGDRMFVIEKGKVKVTKQILGNKEKTLVELKEGDFFGEMALLDGSPRSASVYAVEPVDMLELYRVSLLEFINKYPKIGIKVLKNINKFLVARIRESGDKIKDLISHTSDERKPENL